MQSAVLATVNPSVRPSVRSSVCRLLHAGTVSKRLTLRYAAPCRPVIDCRIDASFGAHCTNLTEARPYCHRQKCRPMTLVSGNIRLMRVIAGVRLGRGVKRHWGLSTTAIFGYLGGYVFENFRDTASGTTLCQNDSRYDQGSSL